MGGLHAVGTCPTLAREVTGEVTQVIRRPVAAHNLTTRMVIRQIGFARDIPNRVCVLHGGRIQKEGTPGAPFGDPGRDRTKQVLPAVRDAV